MGVIGNLGNIHWQYIPLVHWDNAYSQNFRHVKSSSVSQIYNINIINQKPYYIIYNDENNKCYINNIFSGVVYDIPDDVTNLNSIFLFAYRPGNMLYSKYFRLHLVKITDKLNNIIVRNFIPCYRKSDNEIGLYDTVEGKFYTNQGTGKFIPGPDIK